MSVVKKRQRRPFGTTAANTDAGAAQRLPPSPRRDKRRPRKSAKPSTSKRHSLAQNGCGPNASKRSDSKTPKLKNLTASSAAYDLKKEFDSCVPQVKSSKSSKKASESGHRELRKPDPSPIRLPDPTASRALGSKTECSRKLKVAKREASGKREKFISASLKRLFQPSAAKALDAEARQIDKISYPSALSPPGRRHASSDADTACSTPEKDSPLIRSPFNKLEPDGNEVGCDAALKKTTEVDSKRKEHDGKKNPGQSFENQPSSKSTNNGRAKNPCKGHPLGRRQSSLVMVNAHSRPEKDSPLMRSHFNKLDPIESDAGARTLLGKKEGHRELMEPDSKKPSRATECQPHVNEKCSAPPAAPRKNITQNSRRNRGGPHTKLLSAEVGPTTERKTGAGLEKKEASCNPVGQHAKKPVVACAAPNGQSLSSKKAAHSATSTGKSSNLKEGYGQPQSVSKDALDRARNGPTDNKRVLEAMFKSGSARTNSQSKLAENKEFAESLVGSTVGGSSLQRSNSVDESEVTTIDYNDDSSQASMTTRGNDVETAKGGIAPYSSRESFPDSIYAPEQSAAGRKGSAADIFRNNTPAQAGTANVSSRPGLQRASTIETATITGSAFGQPNFDQPSRERSNASFYCSQPSTSIQYIQPSLTRLPAGWITRWSKTKQKPYYVHPDFGATWYCPGLVFEGHSQSQNELFGDQRVLLGRRHEESQISNSKDESNMKKSYSTSDAKSSMMTRKNSDASHMHSVGGTTMTQSGRGNTSSLDSKSHGPSLNRDVHSSRGAGGTNESLKNDSFKRDGFSEGTHDGTSSVQRKDMSSADFSSKCLTQDFESNDNDGAAPGSGGADKDRTSAWDKQNDRDDPLESIDHEQHSDDDVNFDNNGGGSFDEIDDDRSQGQFEEDKVNNKLDDESQIRGTDSANTLNSEQRASSMCSDHDSQGKVNKEKFGKVNEAGASIKRHYGGDGTGASTKSNQQDEANSLASDRVDINALLRYGAKKRKTPLSTIKESLDESAGYQSSALSHTTESTNRELVGVKLFQSDPQNAKNSSGTLSHGTDGVCAKSIHQKHASNDLDNDDAPTGDISDNGNCGYDESLGGFDNQGDYESDGSDQGPTFQSNDVGDDDVSEYSDGDTDKLGQSWKEAQKATRAKVVIKKCKKKIFPPGPLCSLQFLDEIENEEFDTPLWRRMKRKRSTLTSVKRGKAAQKKRERH